MKTTKTQKWLVVLENGQYSRGAVQACLQLNLGLRGASISDNVPNMKFKNLKIALYNPIEICYFKRSFNIALKYFMENVVVLYYIVSQFYEPSLAWILVKKVNRAF